VSFGDIDSDPLDDWAHARIGNELVFTAPASNPLNWNSIYNFGFACDVPPGSGTLVFDAARSGPGLAFVSVAAKAPGGANFAMATPIGSGCGGTNCYPSFYEFFTPASAFDLANSQWALTLQGGNYQVGPSSVAYAPPAGTQVSIDDDVEFPFTLPFQLPYPGGVTGTLWICSNGFVSATSNGSAFDPTVAAFLGGQPRWAALWHDLAPSPGQVLVESTPSVVRISFTNVPHYGGGGTATFQYQFFANGNVHVIYQAIAAAGNNYLVGFTRGAGTPDPGSWNVSANLAGGLSLCTAPAPAVAHSVSARPLLGANITLTTSNIPPGTSLGLSILSTNQLPGLDLTGLGMPGCRLFAGLDSIETFAVSGASASVPFAVPNTPSLSGVEVMSQSATLTPGINPFGFATSNGMLLVLGTQ
jgi:hypothetical protein